jgi:predicted Zn-dependent protease
MALGTQGYQEALAQYHVSHDPVLTEPVTRIGQAIARVANKPDYQWEFTTLDEPKIMNAFCLPGGKVAVFTGIYPIAKNEAGMAVIIGHEVTHALARHGAEGISQGLLAQVGLLSLGLALGVSGASQQTMQTAMAAYGLGATLGVIMPFSRFQESEADEYGLFLAAQAGYDPREAVELWKRFSEAAPTQQPEFLSDHPNHEHRIEDLQKQMPKAMALWEKSQKQESRPLPAISIQRQQETKPQTTPPGFQVTANRETIRFKPERDVFLRSLQLRTPNGETHPLEVKMGLVHGVEKQLSVKGSGLQQGRYTLTFTGERSGEPFTETETFEVR